MATNKTAYEYNASLGQYIQRKKADRIDYDKFATKNFALLLSFF